MKLTIKPGDCVRVVENNVVYVDAMKILSKPQVKTNEINGKIAVSALDFHLYLYNNSILIKKHKKEAMFVVEDVQDIERHGRKVRTVLIEGVLYYHGFFEKVQKVKRRKLL